MVNYLNGVERTAKVTKLRGVFMDAAQRAGSVEAYGELIDREIAGIVITAHPTFGMDGKLYRLLAKLVEHKAGCREHNVDQTIADMLASPHAPPEDISLGYEYAEALQAIENIQIALRDVYRLALDVGAEVYPDGWLSLSPRLLTVATWVAYDLDGRSDISWDVSLRTRFEVARWQLDSYGQRWKSIGERLGPDASKSITERLSAIRAAFDDMLSGFEGDLSDVKSAQHLGLQLQVSNERKPCDVGPVLAEIDALFEEIDDHSLLIDLKIFRAELANFGFGFAHTHVRLNATQLHNAIQRYLNIDGSPDEPGTDVGSWETQPIYLMVLSPKQSTLAHSWRKGRVRNASLWSFRICSSTSTELSRYVFSLRSAILRLRCSVRSTLRSSLVLTISLISHPFLRHRPHSSGASS